MILIFGWAACWAMTADVERPQIKRTTAAVIGLKNFITSTFIDAFEPFGVEEYNRGK
jgi:hypothetical protein